MFERAVEEKRREIDQEMAALGRRLESGDDSELLLWVIPGKLACVHRPLRHHPQYAGSRASIPSAAKSLVLDWVDWLRLEDIASIISFMHDGDLSCYGEIDFDGGTLLEALERHGFQVCRLPWEDPAHSKTDPTLKRTKLLEMRRKALYAFNRLPKPVVLVCSAGRDRSAPAAAYIFESLKARGGDLSSQDAQPG
jgi:hypothetical protein